MFSVIIPLFNKTAFVKRAIDSVLAQTFQDFEVIVVDDGSTDGGGDLVKEIYGSKVKLIKQENAGVSVARNIGIGHSEYPWIAFLDADDYWSPYFLEKNWEIITGDEKVKIIGSHYSSTVSDLEMNHSPLKFYLIEKYFKYAINNYLFLTSATVVKRNCLLITPGFNPKLRSGEDLDIWFRINLQDGNAYYIENTLVYYSSEDIGRLSILGIPFEQTFVFNLKEFLASVQIHDPEIQKDFDEFIDRLIYESLRTRYFMPESHEASKEIFKLKKGRYFLAALYYKLPFKLGNIIVSNATCNQFIRKYFKFLFKIVYN